MSSSSSSASSGVSLGMVLFIVFLVLKLCDVIDWSWWWVTSPLWIPFGVVIAIFAFIVGVIALTATLKAAFNGKSRVNVKIRH